MNVDEEDSSHLVGGDDCISKGEEKNNGPSNLRLELQYPAIDDQIDSREKRKRQGNFKPGPFDGEVSHVMLVVAG